MIGAKFYRSILLLACVIGAFSTYSQSCPTYTLFTGSLQGLTGIGNLVLQGSVQIPVTHKSNYPVSVLRERDKSAQLKMLLDIGPDYVKEQAGWDFSVELTVEYKFTNSSSIVTRTLQISDEAPEMAKVDDVLSAFTSSSAALGCTIAALTVKDGSGNPLTGLVDDFISKNVRLTVTLEREYDIDVRLTTTSVVAVPLSINAPIISHRLATFSWQNNIADPFPNYELQILKLYNTDPAFANDGNQISATVDWSKALQIETQSCDFGINLTLAEGTGYYLWRVRPIGNYYAGGNSNSENYGNWSYSHADGAVVTLHKGSLTGNNPTPFAFYFQDPDQDVNWIYNRAFTEGDSRNKVSTGVKVSEGISYADGLHRVKQIQKYNSSEGVTNLSQTVYDYAGRSALSSIPVPTAGGLSGYKQSLLTTATTGTLYTARDFDSDAKVMDPEPVSSNGAYGYYSGQSTVISNKDVASAEGYPFKRTLFMTDGSHRVSEESGVGKVHAIGTQSVSGGRTTRIMYSTPADDELLRIFGEEAPLATSVLKTTTIDQNNVRSVSYTSKEGKTIATALSSLSTDNLEALSTASTATVTNSVSENISSGGRIVASKRMAIAYDNTKINISYTAGNLPGTVGDCISGDCNFEVRFYMIDVKSGIQYVSDEDASSPGISNFTTAISALTFAHAWSFVSPTSTLAVGGSGFNELILNSGEYIFIKELISLNSGNYVDSLVDAENDRVRSILEALADKMREVDNPIKQEAFKLWMEDFRLTLGNYHAGTSNLSAVLFNSLCIDPLTLGANTLFPSASEFSLSGFSDSPDELGYEEIVVSTKCCGDMSIPMPRKSLCLACDGSPLLVQSHPPLSTMLTENDLALQSGSVIAYGFEDLEGSADWSALNDLSRRDAIWPIVYREFIIPLQDQMIEEQIDTNDLWKVAPGFSYKSLAFMISSMMLSRYYDGSAIKDNGTWHEAAMGSNGKYMLGNVVQPAFTFTNSYSHNYPCRKLWESWIAAVSLLGSFEQEGNDNNIIRQYDKQEGPMATISAILQVDNWHPDLQELVEALKIGVQDLIDKWDDSKDGEVSSTRISALTNVVSRFMEQAGYQFAAVIDGSPLPSYISSSGTFPDDYFHFTHTGSLQPTSIYESIVVGTSTISNVPMLCDDNGAVVYESCSGSSNLTELYYPYVLRPEWMFKYYVYNVYEGGATSPINFINDGDYILPNQVALDVARSYNAPSTYVPDLLTTFSITAADLCNQPVFSEYISGTSTIGLQYVHENWNVSERLSFYNEIKGAARCFTTKGASTSGSYFLNNTPPSCKSKPQLFLDANTILNDLSAHCNAKAGEIRSALLSELELACYTLVTCKSSPPNPGEITINDVDAMVNAVLSSMQTEITAIQSNFTATPVSSLTACAHPSLISQSYSASTSCDLPSCAEVSCYEVVLYNNNSLGLISNNKLTVRYFSDCDQKIIDMLETGAFLPDIPPITGCIKDPKPWLSCTGNSSTLCTTINDYEENHTCTGGNFDKYSKTYPVTASSGN